MNSNGSPNTAVTLELDEELAATIRSSMALGGFTSVDEFLRSAAEEWHQNHLPQDIDQESLRLQIEEGLDSGDPMDFQLFMAEIRTRLDAKRVDSA